MRTTTGGIVTQYLYDGDNVVADLDNLGAVTKQYVTPFLDENLSMTDQNGGKLLNYYYNQDGDDADTRLNKTQIHSQLKGKI